MTKTTRGQQQLGLWDSTTRPSESGGPVRSAPALPAHRETKPVKYQELWDIDDLAAYLRVPKQTIYSWRTTGYGPKGIRVGKHLRWRAATVITWTLGLEQGQ